MRVKNLSYLFVILFSVITFISCDKKEEQSVSIDELVGHWELITIEGWVQVDKNSQIPYEENFRGQENYLVLYEDNTGYFYDGSELEEEDQKDEFQWNVKNRNLSIMYSLTDVEVMNIVEVTSSRLILDTKMKEDNTTLYAKMTFMNMYK